MEMYHLAVLGFLVGVFVLVWFLLTEVDDEGDQ